MNITPLPIIPPLYVFGWLSEGYEMAVDVVSYFSKRSSQFLIEIFQSVILRLVGLLSLPRALLANVVLRLLLKRMNLVEVFMSFVTHVLFLCCFIVIISLIELKAICLFLSIERVLCALYG